MGRAKGMVRYCGAKTRAGSPCEKEAGWGTDHVGAGKCKYHGGSHHNGRLAGAKELATIYAAERFGLASMEPTDAMLLCVRDTAGFVAYCKQRVAEEQGARGEHLIQNGELTVWARLQLEGTDRLARYSKMAIDAGVAERKVQLAERMGDLLASAMERVFDALDLPPKDRIKAARVYAGAIAELEQGPLEDIEGEAAAA